MGYRWGRGGACVHCIVDTSSAPHITSTISPLQHYISPALRPGRAESRRGGPGRVVCSGRQLTEERNAACLLSVGIRMSTEEHMWVTFREIDRRLRSHWALLVKVERAEGRTNAGALRAEARMLKLGRKKQNLDLDFAEAYEWLRTVLRRGESDPRYKRRLENAREMLLDIKRDMARVCEEARVLNDWRNKMVYAEEYMELGGYSLTSGIEKLQSDLSDVLAAGYSSD